MIWFIVLIKFFKVWTNSNYKFLFKNSTKEVKIYSLQQWSEIRKLLAVSLSQIFHLKDYFGYKSNLTPKILAMYSPPK